MSDDQLRLLGLAAHVDLSTVKGRMWSNEVLTDFFHDLQKVFRPKTILEIGAFDAFFSRRARLEHPSAKIIAFEANPHNYAHHKSVHNYEEAGIEYINLAISDRIGNIEFQLQTEKQGDQVSKVAGDNSLLKRAHTEGVIGYETVTVPTTTLNKFLSSSNYVADDFSAWIDVEGAIEMVFSGADDVMKRMQSVFIEVEEREYWSGQWLLNEVEDYMNSHGLKLVARDFENAHQFNVVFVKEDLMKHFMFKDRMVVYINRLSHMPD